MIRAVISDLDGTLIDSLPAWDALPSRLLAQFGLNAPEDLAASLAQLSMEEAVARLKARYALPESAADLTDRCRALMDRAYRREIPLLPGAAEGFARLRGRGLRIAIATAGDAQLARAALERLGLWGDVAFLLTEAQVGRSKRRPDIYLRAAERLGAAPGQCLVLEDAPHAVAAAQGAGFVVCAVGPGAAALPDPACGAAAQSRAAERPCAADLPNPACAPHPLLRVGDLSELEAIFPDG